jgi:transposase
LRINEQESKINEQELKIKEQETRIKELEGFLSKDSHNSNQPPSQDGLRKKPNPKSQKEKSGLKAGGQKGHEGQTLNPVENPDETIYYSVCTCEQCGGSLEGINPARQETRQEFDVPPVKMRVKEHKVNIVICPSCQHENKGKFPEHISQPVQYGPRVKAIAIYLNQFQFLPYERVKQAFYDLFALSLSEGTLFNIIKGCHKKLFAYEEMVKELIIKSKVAHFDESGMRANKKLHWLHVASTKMLTYYELHEKRGSEAMDTIGILNVFQGRAIHDHWKPYFNYTCRHGLCNAHHLRELTYHEEQYQQAWCSKMKAHLLEIRETVEEKRERKILNLTQEEIRGSR